MFFSVLLVGVILINCLHQQLGHSVYMRRFAQYGTICLIKKNMKNTHGGMLLL